ncbi:aminotransferase-like domain-containing protein [Actinokineospora iranica]|uniref:DNA-binding transcriptional regulator, MocR family, contains an aminotransferase domain n=1 Tax=Actinokineospora iranica TaxID=1271860 RepID=A0A1G6QJT1_9PSEU|nr:PLP-dependent aminotransferase family protein [Actinokineospora iranica]SDC92710.1 DNA-binding transcriptional regulator, MocR family, contains an aminotransferase domain [Actinokineospora iranica]
MSAPNFAASRVSTQRLVRMLGEWREHGGRQGSAGLAAGIRLLVFDGQLPPGTLLPAERELAAALGVSRTLVATAWDLLRADGLIVSRRGSGTRTALPAARDREPEPAGEHLIDLARAAPAALPGLGAAIDAVRGSFAAELSGHGYHEFGLDILRERIADRFTARGLPTGPEEVLITNGAHHALALVLRALTGPGDRVLVEQPTYPNAIETMRAAHVVPVPVPLPESYPQAAPLAPESSAPAGSLEQGRPPRAGGGCAGAGLGLGGSGLGAGWDLDGVEAALRQAAPRLAYFVVDFQNPTGRRLDAAGRERLAAALRRGRTPAVVDETLVELDLVGDPVDGPPPMAAFAPNLVVTVGSVSKSHWGGLRLGWVRAPEEVIGRLAAARHAFDLGSPVLEQLVVAQLYADPEPMLRERRAVTRQARDALVAAVRTHCPDWAFELPEGGLSLWCRLPAPIGTRVAVAAQNAGVRVAPGSRFGVHGGLERWLRLPYALPAPVLVDAVLRLSRVAAGITGAPGSVGSDGLIPVV